MINAQSARGPRKRKERTPIWMLCDVFTVDNAQHHQDKTNNRDFSNFTRADKTHVDAHKDRNRNGGCNTEYTHGLLVSALTTTSANTARMIIITPKAPSITIIPAKVPSSCLAISPSDRPSRRVEINSTRKSCTAPASTTPTSSQYCPR